MKVEEVRERLERVNNWIAMFSGRAKKDWQLEALGLRALLWLADDSEWDADSGQSVGDYVAEGLDAKEAILAELEKLEARG